MIMKRTVNLDKGKNTITIYVENDDDDKTYTLNVYRGEDATASTTSATGTSTVQQQVLKILQSKDETNKFNAWKRVDGKWKYIDGTGEVFKEYTGGLIKILE